MENYEFSSRFAYVEARHAHVFEREEATASYGRSAVQLLLKPFVITVTVTFIDAEAEPISKVRLRLVYH